ncbi:hypothetical protein [Evansella clarkii]|uniref:hypothetical protein n=1 Tax=Evansella clarkii TaxID=79879 RepID=UPI00099733C5|nr:hypothetical protein [Evansella clarkii]
MKQIYAFETIEEITSFKKITDELYSKLEAYKKLLEDEYALTEEPKGILWTSEELATSVFSGVPIPAFTDKNLIYMSPDINKWRRLFICQLEGVSVPDIHKFYESYSINQLLIILAHELTHHSDLFLDEFDDERTDSIWFEEGMCFYLPRKILLSKGEFAEITAVESELVKVFKEKYGNHSLDDFGRSSYKGTLTSIMYDYWRSYLTVKELVEDKASGDIITIFEKYHQWHKQGRTLPLTQFFHAEFA